MKATLAPQLSQSVNLTPQLLQSIRLLQLTGLELEQEVARALERNPLLEREDIRPEAEPRGEGAQAGNETASFDELPEPVLAPVTARRTFDGLDDDRLSGIAARESADPSQRVLERLRVELDDDELAIAAWWLTRIGDHGYLEAPARALAAEAAAGFGISSADAEVVRQRILRGEPAGLAAESLRECLRVQLELLPADTRGRTTALSLVDEHLDILGDGTDAVAAASDRAHAQVAAALGLIRTLHARPIEQLADGEDLHIVPDVVVWKSGDGQWQVALNPVTAPKLRVIESYEHALAGAAAGSASPALRELLNEARWIARGVAMRCDTLLRTARAIVERQAGFLEQGDAGLKPLNLRDVADAIGMHESTVSRITTGKYLQTPRGPIEMKRFFSVRLEGASIAGPAIRARVGQLIAAEAPHAPLADETIAGLLARDGIQIARRTVAKYREQLDIASARQRARDYRTQLRRAG